MEMNLKDKNYKIEQISAEVAKKYIIKHHYSHGCHNAPFPCFGLFDECKLIGVIMFACPCSENVRSCVFGKDNKDSVTELHRLHILDCTPKNTESWFIVRSLKRLKQIKPQINGVISFSDTTVGHEGTIYKATNAFRCGQTCKTTFFEDEYGRLRHPRQNGVNISKEEAKKRGWKPVKRESKNRYLYILARDKRDARRLVRECKLDLDGCGHPIICNEKHVDGFEEDTITLRLW